jgi:hypothetical protein
VRRERRENTEGREQRVREQSDLVEHVTEAKCITYLAGCPAFTDFRGRRGEREEIREQRSESAKRRKQRADRRLETRKEGAREQIRTKRAEGILTAEVVELAPLRGCGAGGRGSVHAPAEIE